MRAIVLDAPGPPDALKLRSIPVPVHRPGWVLLAVRAFGLNRSELHTRQGLAGDSVTYPRILGIEATGVVEAADDPSWVGRKAVAMMGGMGRTFDGGYAEYTLVPESQVVLVDTELDWARLGALPEVLQTAYGSMTVGMGAQDGDTILIRGGTSSVGMMVAALGKRRGMRVLSTTRHAERADALRAVGVTDVIVDRGEVAETVREIVPDGVDSAIELVGTPTLRDTLRCTRRGGTVCFTGMLSGVWTVPEFYPIEYIPTGVRLTAYGGDASDLPGSVLSEAAEAVRAGALDLPVKTYTMDQIAQAHDDMEHNRVAARQVVLT
jgi:NADPH:quinone reductase